MGWGCSYGLTWEGSQAKPALGDYYLDLGDKLSAICPSCILLIEGTGQSRFLGVDWCALASHDDRACSGFHGLPLVFKSVLTHKACKSTPSWLLCQDHSRNYANSQEAT